jgi:uncharacterized protein YbjQ (UPF0145 family)
MVELVFQIGLPIALLVVAYFSGSYLEQKHLASIRQREMAFAPIPCLDTNSFPRDRPVAQVLLVNGHVVVSVDYFKRFLAGWRQFFGGELTSYGSLLDRGRREALLRMKEQMPEADLFVNVRLQTSSISQGAANTIGSIEVLAYGTGIRFQRHGLRA